MKLGDGKRFKTITKKLRAKNAKNPDGLAAYLGRKKYGEARFARLSAIGRERALQRRIAGARVKV
jgi:hypothetical protein